MLSREFVLPVRLLIVVSFTPFAAHRVTQQVPERAKTGLNLKVLIIIPFCIPFIREQVVDGFHEIYCWVYRA